MSKKKNFINFFIGFVIWEILYVTWWSSSSAAMPFHLLLLCPKDDGLLRWEKRMTSVCGHLHLSSSYPEIYDCSHTTVIISSSGVISQAAKWRSWATYVNTAKLVFFYSPSTVFENHPKSLIQHCERSELRLHFEWRKVN